MNTKRKNILRQQRGDNIITPSVRGNTRYCYDPPTDKITALLNIIIGYSHTVVSKH